MKYLDTNLTKYVKNLYAENYRKVMGKIKYDKKEILCSYISKLDIVKLSVVSKLIYKCNAKSQKNILEI